MASNKKVLTIDITNESITITEVTASEKKTSTVHNAIIFETPEDSYEDGFIRDKERIAEAIRSQLAANGITNKDAIFVLTSTKIVNREVLVPFVKENKIKGIINANSSEYFPVNIEDYTVSHSVLETVTDEEHNKQLRVLAVAAPTSMVRSYYEVAALAGLKVVALDYIGNAMLQLIKTQTSENMTTMVIQLGSSIILPAFSFSRSQELLTTLYLLFGENEDFKTDIVVDSMLTCDICQAYEDVLDSDFCELWTKVYNWKNVKYVREKVESKAWVNDPIPKIVISSSGFCTNGRILSYLDKYLRDINSMICFSGFVGTDDSYLSYRIKNGKAHKTININKVPVSNRADCITMSTFSSHANFDDLLKFGSNLNTNQLVLVHGATEAKNCLKEHLREEISKNDKCYKVKCSEKDMIIPL